MFVSTPGISKQKPGFPMKNIRFSNFVPQLYNLCTGYAKMRHGTIMPARAFCSDGSQGYPTILMATHFGTFPFDYGSIGGVLDFARSPAFATHGKDLVIVQATHVGFDPQTQEYGRYPRHRTAVGAEDVKYTANCGHVGGITKPYVKGYQSAATHTLARWCPLQNRYLISVRNFFFDTGNKFPVNARLDTNRMLRQALGGEAEVVDFTPVSRVFVASEEFSAHLDKYDRFKASTSPKPITRTHTRTTTPADAAGFIPLGDALTQDWFSFRCAADPGGRYEENIRDVMPWVVTQKEPFLAAAQACVQAEFHRVLNDFYFSKDLFKKKNLIYVSGVAVDVAPNVDQMAGDDAFFPRTLFAPWAASVHRYDAATGTEQKEIWDQDKVLEMLGKQPLTNPRQMKLDQSVQLLREMPAIVLPPHTF